MSKSTKVVIKSVLKDDVKSEVKKEPPEEMEMSPEDIEQLLADADQYHVEELTASTLKRMVLQLEKKKKINQEERIKFGDEPDKFMKVECDLDEEVKRFKDLAAAPELYSYFVDLNGIHSIAGLMSHINTDIAIGAVEVMKELTDPDNLLEAEDPDKFINSLIEAQVCELLLELALRIDESKSEEDSECITNTMSVIENLVEARPEISARFSKLPKFLPWLLKRLRTQGPMNYNKVYASEMMGILLQSSAEIRDAVGKLDGVDKLLRSIAAYRKKDPQDAEEAEYVQNVFNCLCSLMLVPELQSQMGKSQGLELMIRMMKERQFSAVLALRLLDHAVMGHKANCQIFVDKLGLRSIFGMLMKKKIKNKDGKLVEEHCVSVIQSLCKFCKGMATARVLNKFTENGFEKLERLLEMHEEYVARLRKVEETNLQLMEELAEEGIDLEEQKFLNRCEAGLFTLQLVDVILCRIANMGNLQVQKAILHLINMKGVETEEIENAVKEYVANLSASADEDKIILLEYLQFLR